MVNSSLREARMPHSSLTETCCRHTAIKAVWTSPHGHGKLQTGVKFEVRVEAHRGCRRQAASPVPEGQRVATALPVSLSPSSFNGNSHVADTAASEAVVLWFGSRHIIDKLSLHEVQVLSSTVKVDSSLVTAPL